MLLVMNSLVSCAQLPSTVWAAPLPRTSASNESPRSTIPATLRAMFVPDSIATPMSARRSAGTSFCPSPTIAT